MEAVPPPVPAILEDPDATMSDPRELLLAYLEWYREALMRKVEGLSDARLRGAVEPLGWSPLGLIQHLGWVERRWLRWGFAAEQVQAYPSGGDAEEWGVPASVPTMRILSAHADEVARSRALVAGVALDARAAVGGRFPDAEQAPTLGRILFHLLQEYARHVGQLDVARELIDGVRGE